MFKKSLEFLIPLFLLSLYSMALIISKLRWIFFQTLSAGAFSRLLEKIQKGSIREAYEEVPRGYIEKTILSKAILSIQKGKTRTLHEELVEGARQALFPFVGDLSSFTTLANLSTLLGLLGTIVGMILAFYQLKVTGESNPYVLAGGISKALLTTAAGLIIAIPLVLSQNIFQKIARKKEDSMLQLISVFQYIHKENRSNG